jgi:hypothetical protein
MRCNSFYTISVNLRRVEFAGFSLRWNKKAVAYFRKVHRNESAKSVHLRVDRFTSFYWVPNAICGERMELGGRVCYEVKVRRDGHNLSAGTDTLYLSVYEPIAIQNLLGGLSPKLGWGVKDGIGVSSHSSVVPCESPP